MNLALITAGNCDRQGTYEAGDTMTKLADLKKRLMEDPGFQEEYARADDEFTLIEALIRARTAAQLTQFFVSVSDNARDGIFRGSFYS